MNTLGTIIEDLREDAKASRTILSRIPENKLTWKPHEKSMTLGRLGMHIAELPKWMGRTLSTDGMDFGAGTYRPNIPGTHAEIMAEFEASLEQGVAAMQNAPEEILDTLWTARVGERIVWSLPKRMLVRQTVRHIVHHRGQLSVYLRLLDVPLPKLFGPTADER
jgi:uncharacterized damage-inducible protein DinB